MSLKLPIEAQPFWRQAGEKPEAGQEDEEFAEDQDADEQNQPQPARQFAITLGAAGGGVPFDTGGHRGAFGVSAGLLGALALISA